MKGCGVLLPISALPNEYGIGTIGKYAYKFCDILAASHQSYWQVLPISPTSFGDSPYQSFSTFAGNEYFIDLEKLVEEGLLEEIEIEGLKTKADSTIDYSKLYRTRYRILRQAYYRFLERKPNDYDEFCITNEWLKNYALFRSLKNHFNGASFDVWPVEYKKRDSNTLDKYLKENKEDIEFYYFLQYKFNKDWCALKKYANEKGIKIIGDLPIYVAYDSADVWGNPDNYLLDDNLKPKIVAGCPPDAFSATGQLWGNPIYDYDKMEKDDFVWWIKRTKKAFEYFDIVRIDHFRGFAGYYTIPYGDKTAELGKWEKGVGIKLFKKIEAELGKKNFIAEDLGVIDDDVRKLLKSTGYPGMKIIQFAFEGRMDHEYLPINYEENCVAYPGTHDSPTLKEWLEEIPQWQKEFCYKYLKLRKNENPIRKIIKVLQESKANLVIIPLQDYLELGKESRINTPSTLGGNWQYRFSPKVFSKGLINKITSLCKVRIRGK